MGIQLLWRRKRIAWIADIENAFLQIAIQPEHKQMVRFPWVENPEDKKSKIITYTSTRLSFGLTSSPFILRAVLLKHFRQYENLYPGIVSKL